VQVGVQLGEVTSSYELYASGKRIGGVGALPPAPRMEYDRHRIYTLPMASIDENGRILLAIRVWRSSITRTEEGGPTRGPFFIGRLEQLATRALLDGIPYLALVAIFAAVGLYHVRLYVEHRSMVEHLWFGAFALDIAAYSLLRTQWKYSLTDDFILLKNLEYVAIYMLPAIAIQHIASVYSRPIGHWLRAYQLSFVALAAAAGLTPTLRFNISTLWLAQIWILPMIAFAGVVGFQEYRRGHPQAKLLPSAFFLATCLFDLAVDHDWVRGPRMLPVGMTVMIFSMAASLANRLIRTGRELESLTDTLEARVAEQTSQLRERTEQLEQKNRQLEEAQGNLREASFSDPLTGLRNRRFLSEYLSHDVARVLREYAHAADDPGSPERTDLVFLMLDLDHFKVVNDHHGHDAGDRMLAQTADILRELCRKSDFVVRWGGEEFLVVSRFVDRLGAAAFAERIRSRVAEHAFDVGSGMRVTQTCSIGFASFPLVREHPEAHGWQEVVNVADRMLYLAKEMGRDSWAGVCEAEGEPSDELSRRISEDLSGCISRGEIQCQTSRAHDEAAMGEADTSDAEKAESP
jgi:diguanylate cyclase (GGDEF)-like protein